MDSVVLNIAEAAGLFDGRAKSHYRVARGSVLEVAAAYELADAYGEPVPLQQVLDLARPVAAMLTSLGR